MNELAQALDDIDGLQEAFAALSDTQRRSPLVRKEHVAKSLRRELAAASDSYMATLLASARGELDGSRLKKCRSVAMAEMPGAHANQKQLASLVGEKRLPAPDVRADVEQMVNLSLHCRAALATLAPTVDRRAAEACGNKVLVELRGATLSYLAASRDSGDGAASKPRAAVVELLKKAESHANELVALAPAADVTGSEASLGASLSRDVVGELHTTTVQWSAPAPSSEALTPLDDRA